MPEPSSKPPAAGATPPKSPPKSPPTKDPLEAPTSPGAASSGSVAPPPRSVEPGAWRLSPVAKLRLIVALCFVASIALFAVYVGGLRGRSDIEKERILSVARNTQLASKDMGPLIETDFSAYWKDELLCQYVLVISLVLAYAGSGLLLVDRVWNKLRDRKPDGEKSAAPAKDAG